MLVLYYLLILGEVASCTLIVLTPFSVLNESTQPGIGDEIIEEWPVLVSVFSML